MTSRTRASQGFDFTPVLFVIALASVALMISQFSHAWPDAARGLLISEKSCRIYQYYHSPKFVNDAIGIF